MEKKKEFYVNVALEKEERELPVPGHSKRARCACCKRAMPVRKTNQRYNRETYKYEDTPQTKWKYVGYSYFCKQRCAAIFATISMDKKLKLNIKD